MKKKVLVVVAHPDDELIWMGGTLLRHKKDWDTKVICLTRASDRDRCPKFKKVCKRLGVKGLIFDLEDETHNSLNVDEVVELISRNSEKEYDLVYTHGRRGEYGHIKHKNCYDAVKMMLKKDLLKAREVFLFSYLPMENDFQGYAIYNSSADKLIKLSRDELELKKKLITNVYGYEKGGFEELSCGGVEAFDKLE